MKRSSGIVSTLLFTVAMTMIVSAQIPGTISYQGILSDPNGVLMPDGSYDLSIRLYESFSAKTPVYTEVHHAVVIRGLFNVIIGSVSPLPKTLTFDKAYFLGVSVNEGNELEPRTALTAVPYALRAASAESADVAKALAPKADGAVTSLNSLQGDLVLKGSGGVSVSQLGNEITISDKEVAPDISKGNSVQTVPGTVNFTGDLIGNVNTNNSSWWVSIGQLKVVTDRIGQSAVTMPKIHQSGANPNQVIKWNGTSGAWAPGPSMTNFLESVTYSAPNQTVPVVQLVANDPASNVDIALTPKGSGALTGQAANNSASGGNKRGSYVVDWQLTRSQSSQVASGLASAILGGSSNTAAGDYSVVAGGQNNLVTSGSWNAILGGQDNSIGSGNHNAVLGGSGNSVSGGEAFALGLNSASSGGGFALGNAALAGANQFSANYATGYLFNSTMIGDFTSNAATHNLNSATSFISTAPIQSFSSATSFTSTSPVQTFNSATSFTSTSPIQTFNSATSFNSTSPLHTFTSTSAANGYIANFINNTNANGISIQVGAGTPANANDFITFRNNIGGVVGRIEGQTVSELTSDADYQSALGSLNLSIATTAIDVTIASLEEIQAGVDVVAAATSTTPCVGLGVCETVPIASLIVAAAAELVLKTANIVSVGLQMDNAVQSRDDFVSSAEASIGVTYASGAGDYAEWLPKLDPAEVFVAGNIVAVKEGRITKNTDGASQLMVISRKPIVLGNMPEAGKESEYEKVAFMGQVPVMVIGNVKRGDYILANGYNKGRGVAVSPEKMKADDYKRIVGVAWSSSDNGSYSEINVAVGLNTNALNDVVQKQQTQIDELRTSLDKTNSLLERLAAGMDKTSDAKFTPAPSAEKVVEAHSDPTLSQTVNPSTLIVRDKQTDKIVYHQVTRNQISSGFDLALKMYTESGHAVTDNPYLKRIKTDAAFREAAIQQVEKRLAHDMHLHQEINDVPTNQSPSKR